MVSTIQAERIVFIPRLSQLLQVVHKGILNSFGASYQPVEEG